VILLLGCCCRAVVAAAPSKFIGPTQGDAKKEIEKKALSEKLNEQIILIASRKLVSGLRLLLLWKVVIAKHGA